MIKFLYRLYQLFIAAPLCLVATLITALAVIIGCTLGNGHFWGYYPGRWWSQFIIRVLLLPVKVEGREHLAKGQSYVGRNFKWMMKHQLRSLPLVGKACEAAHHIFVDKRGASRIRQSYEQARATLRDGMSLVVFPEGARTFTGHMGQFRRGAFMLADELQLPVCPLTINGSFRVKPRMKDIYWVFWHPLRLTIHEPIQPVGQGADNIRHTEEESYRVIMSALEPEYQGFVENPDQ